MPSARVLTLYKIKGVAAAFMASTVNQVCSGADEWEMKTRANIKPKGLKKGEKL